jgi:hypothetical protein
MEVPIHVTHPKTRKIIYASGLLNAAIKKPNKEIFN